MLRRKRPPARETSTISLYLENTTQTGGHATPGRHDGMLVVTGADVSGDVSVLVTRPAGQRVVGLTDGEEERGVVTRRQLDDVSEQRRRTEPKHMHTWDR